MYIGLKKGDEQHNRAKACAKRPQKARVADVASALKRLRAQKVRVENVGMTRFHASGTYRGAPESSAIYELIDTGVDGGWNRFRKNVGDAAKALAKRLCQDEVIVTFETPKGDQHTCAFGWGAGAGSTRSSYCEPGGLSGFGRRKRRR